MVDYSLPNEGAGMAHDLSPVKNRLIYALRDRMWLDVKRSTMINYPSKVHNMEKDIAWPAAGESVGEFTTKMFTALRSASKGGI